MLVPLLLILIAALAFGGGPLRRALGGAARVWRPTTGLLAVVLMVGAAVLAVREDWLFAGLFLAGSLASALAARRRRAAAPAAAPAATAMSAREARSILGVAEGASAETIEAAYRRLIRMAHPDGGGTAGLAAQLNAARAALLPR